MSLWQADFCHTGKMSATPHKMSAAPCKMSATLRNVGSNMLNVCQGPKVGLDVPPGAPLPLINIF